MSLIVALVDGPPRSPAAAVAADLVLRLEADGHVTATLELGPDGLVDECERGTSAVLAAADAVAFVVAGGRGSLAAARALVPPGEAAQLAIVVGGGATGELPVAHVTVAPADVRLDGGCADRVVGASGELLERARKHLVGRLKEATMDSTLDTAPDTTADAADPACAVPLPTDLDALTVDPAEAAAAIAGGALFVDVRHPDTRAKQGEAAGAEIVGKADVTERFGGGAEPADRRIVVICGSEGGSGPVVAALRELGYTAVSHVRGGYPAWIAHTG